MGAVAADERAGRDGDAVADRVLWVFEAFGQA